MQLNKETLKNIINTEFSIDFIEEELENIEEAKAIMDAVFANREILCLGLYMIKIKKTYAILQEKYSSLMFFFHDVLSSKTIQEIILIEEQEDEIMSIIKHQPKNLEQLNDTKIFLSAHLKERLDYIDNHTKLCFECIDALEKFKLEVEEQIAYRA